MSDESKDHENHLTTLIFAVITAIGLATWLVCRLLNRRKK